IEKGSAVYGGPRAAGAKIREISVGKQAVPRRDHRHGSIGDSDRRSYDVPRAHHLLSTQPLFVRRHDMGPDVCAPRTGRRGAHHVGHGACLLCGSTGKVGDYEVYDLRIDEARVLSETLRPETMGR